MKMKISFIFLFLILMFGYQNCAEEINIEELKISSLCYREPDAIGCSNTINDDISDLGDDDSNGNNGNSSDNDDTGNEDSGSDNDEEDDDDEDKGSAPFTHSIFGPSSALEDSELTYYVQNNGDERNVSIEWSYRCPGDQSTLKNIGSSSTCQNGVSCIKLVCNEEGDISNQAMIQANIKYMGFTVKTLTKSTTITEATKLVVNPSIQAPNNAQLINQAFNLSINWPSNKPSNLLEGASYTWNIASGCSLVSGNKNSASAIKVKCPNVGTHQFGFSYTSEDYRGSASANVQVIGSLEITKNISSMKVGETKRLSVTHSNLPNPKYTWTTNLPGCKGNDGKPSSSNSHSLKCVSRPTGNNKKVKFTLTLESGSIKLQDDIELTINRGSLSLTLNVPGKEHLKGERPTVSVSVSPAPSDLKYEWEINNDDHCKIYGSGKSVKAGCDTGPGGPSNIQITVSNNNYSSSTSKQIKFLSSNAISLANCQWMSSSTYNYAPGYVPSSYHAILNYTAPKDKVLVGISSYYSSSKQDRKWNFKYCDLKVGSSKLSVSTAVKQAFYNTKSNYYANKQNILEDGECALDEAMTGKYGLYGQKTDDRGYALYCAKPSYGSYKTKLTSCEEPTSKQYYNAGGRKYEYEAPTYTTMKSYFKYECPTGKVLRGEESLHQNAPDDRKFRYQCCSMEIDI
ncbi:MAG: hypothetical protein VX642_14020 [Bdellovibrionota bacterium]|nr:hypothetical protein [Bdellovibrionota bacterium]